jgi:colanic acid biosynthesis glycosyl transferase WcaI
LTRSKIIFVNRVYRPSEAATAQLLSDLADGLAERGWPVHVIAAGEEGSECDGVQVHRTGPGERHQGWASRIGNYLRFLRSARRILTTLAGPGDIVVLLTDPPLLAPAVTALAHRRGARVIQWIQDIYPEIAQQHAGSWSAGPLWPLRVMRNRAWRQAVQCVLVGGDLRTTVEEAAVDSARTTTLPNWAPRELDVPAAPAEIAAQREAWNLSGKFVVAYSGNLGRVHEFATLLDAAGFLRDDDRVVFLFIGEGARYGEVRAAAHARALPHVRFLPAQPRERLAITLAAADAHLVTLKPGFERLVYPSKLAGIMAAGRPALFVGSPGCAIASLLAREGCGLTFAPGWGRALADAVRRWRAHPAESNEMGRAARLSYERHFTFRAALAAWETILQLVSRDD